MGTQHRQDVIEINGKKYDAVTGKLISSEGNSPAPIAKSPVKKSGVALDGFVRSNNATQHKASRQPNPSRTVTNHKKPTQKSHTLMRTVVHKPAPLTASKPVSANNSVITKPSLNPSHALQHAAATVKKNPLVSRYGDFMQRSSVVKKIQDLPVKSPLQHSPSTTTTQHHTSLEITKTNKVSQSTRSHATSALIEKALASATSHEQPQLPPIDKKRRHKLAHKLGVSAKTMAISSSVLAGVLLGGFFAIQNVPNLSMRVAAARAGFSASMPNYNPSGFSFKGPINYSPGIVTISFRSNTDDRAYTLTQRASNWNSDALLSNFVASSNKQYQTYLDRGRTLYIYDGSNATWIDNGVWYQVEGESNLTTDQLVRIAASI